MDKWLELLKNNDYIGIKQQIKSGADLSDVNDSGESVLACAIRSRCDFDLLTLLIEGGADIFDFDDEGVSIFDMAITYNNIKMVQYLIDKEINVNQTNRRSGKHRHKRTDKNIEQKVRQYETHEEDTIDGERSNIPERFPDSGRYSYTERSYRLH